MARMNRPRAIVALCTMVACGDPAPQLELRRVGGPCGATADARTLLLRALTDAGEFSRAISVGAPVELTDLPATTRQLTIEVLGSGGVTRAIGKTAPLTLGELATGDVVSIAMAPPDSACRTEPLLEARTAPLLARAGRFVLVLGGQGATGALASAELYDPRTDRFESVPVPSRLAAAGTFIGAAATTLGDGRVVVSGGPTGSYTVFDPETKRFAPPIVLEARFFHGAVALGADRLLVAGGCRGVAGVACNGEAARPTFRLAVDSDQQDLASSLARDHVQPTMLLDAGTGGRGASVLVIGGATAQGLPIEIADRIDLSSGAVTEIRGVYATATTLDSGAVLTGFATGTLAARADTSVVTQQLLSRAVAGAPSLRDASLTTLEDGTALVLGQSADDVPVAAFFRPTQNAWESVPLPAEITDLSGHRALRLDDGSVLIVGAGRPAAPDATAWRFRPSLLGPFTASTISVPTADRPAQLTPSDPDAVDRSGGRFALVGNRAGLSQWVILGGPRLLDGRLSAVVRAGDASGAEDGFAIITHFESPARMIATLFVVGEPVRVQRMVGAELTELCRGRVAVAMPGATSTVTLTLRAGALTVRLDDSTVLDCTVPELTRGAWGLAVMGVATRLGIDTLTVER